MPNESNSLPPGTRDQMIVRLFILAVMICVLTACDAPKIVSVCNKSPQPVELRTDFPRSSLFIRDSTGTYVEHVQVTRDLRELRKNQMGQIDTADNGLIVRLQPGQSFDLAHHMGSGFIGIRAYDLDFSRLTIYSACDTIVAVNKEEIMKLFSNAKTCFVRKLDRNDIGFTSRHSKYIIIRQ